MKNLKGSNIGPLKGQAQKESNREVSFERNTDNWRGTAVKLRPPAEKVLGE